MSVEDPRDQLLVCSDILVGAAEWQQARGEWEGQLEALTIEYADADQHPLGETEDGVDYYLEGDELEEHPDYQRWLELMEHLEVLGPPPMPPFTAEELDTALWQLPELAIGLLMVFTEMVDEQTGGRAEREQVAEIVRPKLYVPGS